MSLRTDLLAKALVRKSLYKIALKDNKADPDEIIFLGNLDNSLWGISNGLDFQKIQKMQNVIQKVLTDNEQYKNTRAYRDAKSLYERMLSSTEDLQTIDIDLQELLDRRFPSFG
jgi:hypothetical protein